jgi:homoserine acetyltransferase
MAEGIIQAGGHAEYREMHSRHGHDAFLKDWDALAALIQPLLTDP